MKKYKEEPKSEIRLYVGKEREEEKKEGKWREPKRLQPTRGICAQ